MGPYKFKKHRDVKLLAHVADGSKADVTLLNFDVRFTPESGHPSAQSKCPLWATSRQSASQQNCLFDHLVGTYKQGRRDFETKRSGGSQVDHQIESGRLHERQFANFLPF